MVAIAAILWALVAVLVTALLYGSLVSPAVKQLTAAGDDDEGCHPQEEGKEHP